ncbi:MAG: hypothetical protein KGI33_06255 [Thaumarchaeota archaeon]|nr:hypothetical protein [Nitrososphaerota archaeon]
MEALTKKTVMVEFEGKKYALSEDLTIGDLLASLGKPVDMPVRLQSREGGFVLVSNN